MNKFDSFKNLHAQMLDAVGDAVIATDLEGNIQYWNMAAVNLFQWTPEEVLGVNILEVTPSNATQQQAKAIMKSLTEGETWSGEFELQRKDGSIFLAEVIDSPICDENGQLIGIIGVSRDITSRKETFAVLRENEKRYRMMFEGNPHPMWVYALESLAFLEVNDAAIHQYGYSRDEFLSMTIKDIRPAEDIPDLLENISRITDGLDEAGVWRHQKKDGTLIEVEIISHVLLWTGKQAELVLANNITERIRAEKEIMLKMAEIERINDLYVGREGKMIDLKGEINALLEELGRPAKYSTPGELDELLAQGL